MNKLDSKFQIAVFFVFIVSIFCLPMLTRAISGEGLTISPPINEPEINPGETKSYIIKISNPTQSLIQATPRVMDFQAKNETGEPNFINPEGNSGSYALSKWVTFEEPKIALAPNQVKEFTYKISVPANAESGGHYGAMFFATDAPQSLASGSQVSLSTMIGSLILVRVPGDIEEKAIIEGFSTNKKIYFKAPSIFTTRVTNVGNIHIKPHGGIDVKGTFGAPVDQLIVNEQNGNVLPQSTRKFENRWSFSPMAFGYFKGNLSLIYGESGKNLTATMSFWIIPWWLIVILVVAIISITILISFIKRRKNQSAKAQKPAKSRPQGPPASPNHSSPPQGPILR